MNRPAFAVPLAGMCAAIWPAWLWFASGSADSSNDCTGLLAAATAVAIAWRAAPRPAVAHPLVLPGALLAAYAAASAAGMSNGACAALAAAALAALASAYRLGRRLDFPLLGLCLLSLPLAASLQFYFGYPLRVLAGNLSAAMLRANGIAVVRDGAMLAWDGQLVSIDAPCSGIKMLWAGLFLACALAASARLPAPRAAAGMLLAAVIVVAANAVRAAALFYSEVGLISAPPWTHAGVGVFCFVAAALGIAVGVQALKGAAQ